MIITSHVFKKKEHKPPQSLWLAHEGLFTSLSNEVNLQADDWELLSSKDEKSAKRKGITI